MSFQSDVEHRYADNDGVKIHYAALGKGSPIVLIHGFPDFWYTWRNQMPALAEHYLVVAMDQRGYNLSDRPKGEENYSGDKLVSDVRAVIRSLGFEKATIVGHDWGGFVAWSCALRAPEIVDKLVILNVPHPIGFARELTHNPEQQKASQYARNYQQPDHYKTLSAEKLTEWVTDPAEKRVYLEAFERSDFEAIMNFYKRSYPHEPYHELDFPLPKVKSPTLYIHGLKDWALLPGAINDTWLWMEKDFTLVTVPDAGHFVHHDASAFVTATMLSWLNQREGTATTNSGGGLSSGYANQSLI